MYISFWERHPVMGLAFDQEFVRRPDSSDIMDCIEMYSDPRSEISMETDDAKRLSYIRKKYPDFDPEDPVVIEQIETYMGLVSDAEVDYIKMLKMLRAVINFYDSRRKKIDDTTPIKDVTALTDGLGKATTTLKDTIKLKKDLTAARSVAQEEGIGNYIPSRAEQGTIGR